MTTHIRKPREGSTDLPSWISAVSQLAATLILLVGYFYTVKPAYDREKLQQEVQRLTEESRTQQDVAAEAVERASEALRRISSSRDTQQRLTQDIQRLSEERQELEIRLSALRDANRSLAREAEVYGAQARTALETARDAQEVVFTNALTLFLAQRTWNKPGMPADLSSRHGSPDALRETWEDYSASLAADLESFLTGDSRLPIDPTLLAEFRNTARMRFRSLGDRARCPSPDFDAWSGSITQAYAAFPAKVREATEQCGRVRFSRWVQMNEWSEADIKRLQGRDWWEELAAEQSTCPFSMKLDVISFPLTSRWSEAQLQCVHHMAAIQEHIVRGSGVFEEAPREALNAPSPAELIEEAQRYLPALSE